MTQKDPRILGTRLYIESNMADKESSKQKGITLCPYLFYIYFVLHFLWTFFLFIRFDFTKYQIEVDVA